MSALVAVGIGIFLAPACASEVDDEELVAGHNELKATRSFVAKGTGYFPDASPMEGGFVDRKGAKLRTLQQFLEGKAEYVSVAMDTKAFPYGQRLRIRQLNTKYNKEIIFRVVDTGGAFKGKGTSRIDISSASR